LEFGKVPYIDNIDFTLPPDADDPVMSQSWLAEPAAARTPAALSVYIGGTEWGRATWVGRVYPAGTKQKDFLTCYARQFNTVELNTLFYGLQPPAVIQRWAAATGDGFRFCPKFPETISHRLQLSGAGGETHAFIETVRHFGAKLGPSFLQLSEGFGPDRADLLQDFVRRLPSGFRVCVELRHEDWFRSKAAVIGRTWDLFRQLGIGMVITDVAGRRDVLHMRLTAPVAFIRFVTNGLHPTDHQRADAWVERIGSWVAKGLREVYLFVHSPGELTSPDVMAYLIGRLNETCGTSLRAPNLVNGGQAGNLSLF
jgi:uncharacterized protein YecE (DUF72 family)